MFLKSIIACDPEHPVKDLDALLDVLDSRVDISGDVQVLKGQVADSLAHASPHLNVHDKVMIDASSPTNDDPMFGLTIPDGPGESLIDSVSQIEGSYSSQNATSFDDGCNHTYRRWTKARRIC